jgi:hypothetical protein
MMNTGWSLLKRAPLLLVLFSFSALAQNVTEVRIENYKYFPAEIASTKPGAMNTIAGHIRK